MDAPSLRLRRSTIAWMRFSGVVEALRHPLQAEGCSLRHLRHTHDGCPFTFTAPNWGSGWVGGGLGLQ